MVRKRKKQVVGILLLIAVFFGKSIYGMITVSVTNRFETSEVRISLTEHEKEGENERPWVNDPVILPGDKISKIPRIHNEGSDCYVRVKLCFEEMEGVDETCLFGMQNDWVKAEDGYFYYQKILPHDESVDVFQGVKIPINFSEENEGKKLSMKIVADAIQSKNFVPSLQSKTPWGEVKVIATEQTNGHEVNFFEKEGSQLFSITYEGNSGKLISNSEDFFQNIPVLLPGDKYEDSIKIVNQSETPMKLYFRSILPEQNELANFIYLEIEEEIGGLSTVYEGNLKAEVLEDNVILGTIPQNSEAIIKFRISVPKELDNRYALQNSSVQWIFSTEPIENRVVGNVQTGDRQDPKKWMLLFAGAVICFAAAGLKYRKERRNADDTDV